MNLESDHWKNISKIIYDSFCILRDQNASIEIQLKEMKSRIDILEDENRQLRGDIKDQVTRLEKEMMIKFGYLCDSLNSKANRSDMMIIPKSPVQPKYDPRIDALELAAKLLQEQITQNRQWTESKARILEGKIGIDSPVPTLQTPDPDDLRDKFSLVETSLKSLQVALSRKANKESVALAFQCKANKNQVQLLEQRLLIIENKLISPRKTNLAHK